MHSGDVTQPAPPGTPAEAALWPVAGEALPAGQGTGAAPAGQYEPAGQAIELEAEPAAQAMPAEHVRHTLAPAAEYWPAAQATHVEPSAAPVAAENVPAAHCVQLAEL